MEVIVVALRSVHDLKNYQLRERAKRAHGGRSREFVALKGSEEAGFLSYEDWPEKEQGFIYEIYVLENFRQQGIGQRLLEQVETHARTQGRKEVRLKPHALDVVPSTDALILWYSEAGYGRSPDEKGILVKQLVS